jgi:hypothetical protein
VGAGRRSNAGTASSERAAWRAALGPVCRLPPHAGYGARPMRRSVRAGTIRGTVVLRCGSAELEAFHFLTGELGDELEVLVDVEHGEIGEFGGRCDQEVGNRRRPMLPAFGEHRL